MSTEDSQMLSDESEVATPLNQITTNPLSPPDSQHRDHAPMPTAASGASIANSNGKRPLTTISNGADDMDELHAIASGKTRADTQVKTHAASGYQYAKEEDAPGYAWLNKKAQDEALRAWDQVQHKDCMVGRKFGDIFAMMKENRAAAATAGSEQR